MARDDQTLGLNFLVTYRVNSGTAFYIGYDDHYQQRERATARLVQDSRTGQGRCRLEYNGPGRRSPRGHRRRRHLNPARPAEVGSVFLEGFATDVLISGSLAYASDRPTGLYVLDLSNPNAVELVTSSQSTSAMTFQAQLALERPEDGPPLLVLVAGGLLQLYDISEPTEPVKLPPYAPPGGVLRASFRGSLAYVTGSGGLFVVDLSTPASPRIVGRHQTRSFDVAVDGSLVFLTALREGVVILRQNP